MSAEKSKLVFNIKDGVRHNGQGSLIVGEAHGDTHIYANTPQRSNANEETKVSTELTSEDGIFVAKLLVDNKISLEDLFDSRLFHKFLTEETLPEKFANKLNVLGALTDGQLRDCLSKQSNQDQNTFLYEILAAENKIKECIAALEQSENMKIILKMKERVEKLKASKTKPKVKVELKATRVPISKDETVPKDLLMNEQDEGGSHFEHHKKDMQHVNPEDIADDGRKQIGTVLIINNNFDGTANERFGSLEDVKTLRERFGVICGPGSITYKKNVKKAELGQILQQFKAKCLRRKSNYSVVIIMTHGDTTPDYLLMNDDKPINLYRDLVYKFNMEEFKEFKNNERIFFIQACREILIDSDARHEKGMMENIFIGQSCLPNKKAFRTANGTFYIQELCEVLRKKYKNTDLKTMHKKVRDNVLKKCTELKLDRQEPHPIDFEFNKNFIFGKK